jgi:hypothetical protein
LFLKSKSRKRSKLRGVGMKSMQKTLFAAGRMEYLPFLQTGFYRYWGQGTLVECRGEFCYCYRLEPTISDRRARQLSAGAATALNTLAPFGPRSQCPG